MSKALNAWVSQGYRKRLLATASAAALLGSMYGVDEALAADRSPLWIEFGWHYEAAAGQPDAFAPPFLTSLPRPDFETISPLNVQKMSLFSYGADGKISFQPDGSDWIFSAALRYGRSHGRKSTHQQTPADPILKYGSRYITPSKARFTDTRAANGETHAIVDFQVGKDVGIGRFGNGGTSELGLGVRFAQFHMQASADINSDPDFHFYSKYVPFGIFDTIPVFQQYHLFEGHAQAERNFRGLGPSISWNASAPLLGNTQDGEVTLDWGLNAAALFGRQKANVHEQTIGHYYNGKYRFTGGSNPVYKPLYNRNHDRVRSKNVVVPNLGGFAGLSLKWDNAKLSLGYRADFFFGAIDGGMDSRKSIDQSFNGPYASISIGLGD